EHGLEAIERNVRIQMQLVNDLLDMSRIISGKVHLEVQPIHLHEIVNNAIEAVHQSADAKNIRIRKMLDSRIGLVRGDPNRLQQVLWNLLSNAIKFTPKGGRVQVVLERVNSHAEICIEDDGIGIRDDLLPHVFDRFRQGESGTTRHFGGLGLGLSIVKSLVHLHGGTVEASSAGTGKGAKFVVVLPVGKSQEEGAPRARKTAGRRLTKDTRVLVVEDHDD